MHASRNRKIILTVIATMIVSPALAEQPVAAVEFIRQNPSYRNAVQSVIDTYELELRTHCASVELDWSKAKVHVALQPTLDAKNHIQASSWVETVPGEACGRHRQYNAESVFDKGRSTVFPLFPGQSESNPLLQQDTVTYVTQALIVTGDLPKNCHIDVLETQLPNGRPTQRSPWIERWRVDACGAQFWSTVDFTPDATGTAIGVSPKDIVPAT